MPRKANSPAYGPRGRHLSNGAYRGSSGGTKRGKRGRGAGRGGGRFNVNDAVGEFIAEETRAGGQRGRRGGQYLHAHEPYGSPQGGRGGQGFQGGRGRGERLGEEAAYAAIGFMYTPMAKRSCGANNVRLEKEEMDDGEGEEDVLEVVGNGSTSQSLEGQAEAGSAFRNLAGATQVEDEDADGEEVVWPGADMVVARQTLVLSTYEQELEVNPHFGLGFDSGCLDDSTASPTAPVEADILYTRSARGLGFGAEDIQSGPEGLVMRWGGVPVERRRSARGGGGVSSAGFLKIGGVKVYANQGGEGGSMWVRGREKALHDNFDILNLDEDEEDEEGGGREDEMYVELSDSDTDEDAQNDYEQNLAEGGWEAGAEEMQFLAGRGVGEYAAIEDMRARGESSDTDLSENWEEYLEGAESGEAEEEVESTPKRPQHKDVTESFGGSSSAPGKLGGGKKTTPMAERVKGMVLSPQALAIVEAKGWAVVPKTEKKERRKGHKGGLARQLEALRSEREDIEMVVNRVGGKGVGGWAGGRAAVWSGSEDGDAAMEEEEEAMERGMWVPEGARGEQWPVGGQAKGKKKKKHKAVPGEKKKLRREGIETKRAQRAAQKGFSVHEINERITAFVEEEEDLFAFPPMEAYERAQVHKIASAYGLKSSSQGSNKKRFTVLARTERTGPPSHHALAPIITMLQRAFPADGSAHGHGRWAEDSDGFVPLKERVRREKKKRKASWQALPQPRGGGARPRGQWEAGGDGVWKPNSVRARAQARGGRGGGGGSQKQSYASKPMSFVSSGVITGEAEGVEEKRRGKAGAGGGGGGIGVDPRFGDFEVHTKGFGSRMMARMGFKVGDGLGKDGQGQANPIEAVKRPKMLGLGASV